MRKGYRDSYTERYGTDGRVEWTFQHRQLRPPVKPLEYRTPTKGHYIYPCMSLRELGEFIEVDPKLLLIICRRSFVRFPIFLDTAKGWMAGMQTVSELCREVHALSGATVDRVSLMLWMAGTKPLTTEHDRVARDCKPFFEVKIEQAIARIAKLPEPQRTIQASKLMERYTDANLASKTIRERKILIDQSLYHPRKIEQFGRKLSKVLHGKGKGKNEVYEDDEPIPIMSRQEMEDIAKKVKRRPFNRIVGKAENSARIDEDESTE